jgi:hypothetical protein
MIKSSDLLKDLQVINDLTEMAIADQDELGFAYFVYISGKEGVSHGPRVKFAKRAPLLKTNDSFSLTIDPNPTVIAGKADSLEIEKKAVKWVQLNLNLLLAYWNDPLLFGSTKSFLSKLKPV